MDKYFFDESNGLWYELQGDYDIPCLTLPAEKKTSLSAYRDSGTNTIYRNIGGRFTLLYSQVAS